MEIKTGPQMISIYRRGVFQMGLNTTAMEKKTTEAVLLYYAVEEINRLKVEINHLKQELSK